MSRHADAPASVPVGARDASDEGEGEGETGAGADTRVASCSTCGRETLHDVALAMLSTATDGIEEDNRKFARCPGRVLTCRACGAETRSLANR